ncbi:MAG TPA: hypothetical protein VM925_02510 [Labilithrix sp.]|nr:hypothetical protein [Labilithrix sp.]
MLVACEPIPGSGTTSSSTSSSGSTSSGSSSVRRPINSEKLCARLISECKQAVTMETCRRQFTAILVTSTCADALAAGSCSDLMSSTSPILDTCFPPCSGTLASCNGDGSITTCTTAGTTNVLDCEEACLAEGARGYSGTCGTSYGAAVSDRQQCWCK